MTGIAALAASMALALITGTQTRVSAASEDGQARGSGPTRIIVTIVVEGLRIPAVSVELRNIDRNIVIAQTKSDAIGHVTFPDVPPGRYLVHAIREGFAGTDSAPFSRS